MSPAALILVVVVGMFIWALLTLRQQSLAGALAKMLVGIIALCLMLIIWEESLILVACTGMGLLLLLFGLADLIVVKLKAVLTGASEQSLGGDSKNRAEDGTVSGAPQG